VLGTWKTRAMWVLSNLKNPKAILPTIGIVIWYSIDGISKWYLTNQDVQESLTQNIEDDWLDVTGRAVV